MTVGVGLLGFIVAVLSLFLPVPQLQRAQLLDVPNSRSSHERVTPRGGGLGVVAAVVVTILAAWVAGLGGTRPTEAVSLSAVVVSTVALGLLGLLDDIRDLGPHLRLLVQLLIGAGVATAVVWSSSRLGIIAGFLAVLAGTVWAVAYVNAFNFMDGVNAISGLSAATGGAWYALLGHQYDNSTLLVAGLAVAGASLGFLPWNAPKARVFLGDVGSYGIGAILATLALIVVIDHEALVLAAAPLSVYLADTSWTLFRRWQSGASLKVAHRDHVYQRLNQLGFSHLGTSFVVTGLSALACVVAWLVPPLLAVLLIVPILIGYLVLPRLLAPVVDGRR